MNLTFDEAIENHRKMWNWIADETEKQKICIPKSKYFSENDIFADILHSCFCCEYTANSNFDGDFFKSSVCELCPISWGYYSGDYGCEKPNSCYDLWVKSLKDENWQSAAKYARQIANLPVREEARR